VRHWQYPKIQARSDSASSQGGPWIAAEKIHGAQLVIATDGHDVQFGKRKAWLHDDEPFFGWQMLRVELDASVRRIHAGLGAPGVLRLFGEIFGGAYPDSAVPAIPGMTPVQTGIWYSPRISFALFDILVQEHDEDEGSFLAHDEVVRLARPLLTVPIIARGSRADLDALPIRFITHIPRELGLPEIPGNFAEGMVFKQNQRLPTTRRLIVKRKIPEFDEQRFDESRPWDANKAFNLEDLIALASQFINSARIASAESKVGDSNPEAVVEEVALDILTDLEAVFPQALSNLALEEEELLLRRLLDKIRTTPVTCGNKKRRILPASP
jgi:Rnl2 family RNA ligase